MPRISSTVGLAIVLALVMLMGVSLSSSTLSPFDSYVYNNSAPRATGNSPAAAAFKTAPPVAPVAAGLAEDVAAVPVAPAVPAGVTATIAVAVNPGTAPTSLAAKVEVSVAEAAAAAAAAVGKGAPANVPSPDQKHYGYEGPLVMIPTNLEKDILEYKERQKKEEEKRIKEEKKKKEEAEKKQKEDEKKKKEEEEKKKKEAEKKKEDDKKKEEEDKKKKEEGESKAREEEQKMRIKELAADQTAFDKLREKVEQKEKDLEPLKKDLDAAKKEQEDTKKKDEEDKKDKEKEAAKKLSGGLAKDFHRLERAEIKEIVENPLNYTEAEKTDNGHVGPYGNKVVILSASNNKTESEQFMLVRALANRQEYCNMHGYTCQFINLDDVDDGKHHIVWAKIKAMEQVFDRQPDAEWVWWMDTDMVILNPYIELGEHLLGERALTERLSWGRPIRAPDATFKGEVYHQKGEIEAKDIHLLLTQDFFGINAGSLFLRKSQFSRFLLDLWYDQHFIDKNYVFREQQALNHLLRSHRTVKQHTGLYPQRLFNSYLGNDNDVWKFKKDDLVVHFAGCGSSNSCKDKFSRHMKIRQRVPKEFQVENHPSDD